MLPRLERPKRMQQNISTNLDPVNRRRRLLRRGGLLFLRAGSILIIALVTAVIVRVAWFAPWHYAFRGSYLRCSDIKQGMSLTEINQRMRHSPSPKDVAYIGAF